MSKGKPKEKKYEKKEEKNKQVTPPTKEGEGKTFDSKPIDWKDEIDNLIELLESGMSVPAIARKYKRTYDSVRQAIRRYNLQPYIKHKKGSITYEDKKFVLKDANEVWESLESLQRSENRLISEQHEITISIDNKGKAIGVCFPADTHIGAKRCRYDQMREDAELIRVTNNLYAVANGDYSDNYVASSPKGGQFEAQITPEVQRTLGKEWIETIQEKLWAMTRGCHDYWSMDTGDFDYVKYLAKHADAINLGPGGKITLKLGQQVYTIGVRHKYKGKSIYDQTAPTKRLYRDMGPYDVTVTSHFHIPALSEETKQNGKVLFIQTGSYKTGDRYIDKIGGTGSGVGVPVVIFYPDRHDFRGFLDLREGIEYLKYINKEK